MAGHKDTLFRSAEMSLIQLYLARDIGREAVSALGELGEVQFRDLNSETTAFQRTFTKEIRQLANVERQLRFFHSQLEGASIPVRPLPSSPEALSLPSQSEIQELAERCGTLEQRIASLIDSYETLKRRELELKEWRWAHGQADDIRTSADNDEAPLLEDVERHGSRSDGELHGERSFHMMDIGFVAGVVARDRIAALERILWRTLRGNLYMNQAEIPEPLTNPSNNEAVDKNVFVIFAHGKEIVAKIRKICETLGASLYSVDENGDMRRDQIQEVNARLTDLASVLDNTKNTRDAELTQISRSLASWLVVVKKEKGVYDALNRFSYDSARKTLVAEAWCPTNSLPAIRATLQDVNYRAGMSVPSIVNELRTNKTPPTYVRTNKFTEAFQTIINAYGTAKYREVNPGLPTIVTFPFLFAVMFGDVGHGFILTAAAAAMILYEQKLSRAKLNELVYMAFYGRYIMLLMGVFSIYTGLIYNDIFSKSLTLFKSQWEWPPVTKEGQAVEASLKEHYRYPFGLDWGWHGTENELLFTNSFKMKLSVLLGWAHMTYSLCFSYINARHFRSSIDIWGNFLPGLIFFQSIFGYLVFTIVYKWSVDWLAVGQSPPGLLNTLIYMFLAPGTVDEPLYRGQGVLQVILVLVALACVPILLFLKPFYLRWEHNRARALGYRGIGETTRVSALDGDDEDENRMMSGGRDSFASEADAGVMITEDIGHSGGEHEEFEFGEVMIHQVIHTIEFCLNCVSHTASYLRLWALSLAHQQLSIVLWNMTIGAALKRTGVVGVIMIVLTFYLWFVLTFFVLCVMEGTSAMLHSLRLHWVEAMSKHFIGEGIPFEPFSFKLLLEEDTSEG
ncbi:MAG: H(+)-transporting V0 sector ATPase subunit a [Lichina confinis]|nr:MAG: H(+)-transporting V0 sector ATPase subunit a [Lichina confinis]